MSRGWPGLPDSERVRRWSLAEDLMEREGLDALLVYGEREGVGQPVFAPDTWLTNDRPGNVVMMPRGGEPYVLVNLHIAIGDHIEARRRGDLLWIPPERMFAAPGASRPGAGRGAAAVTAFLRERGLERGRIGVVGLEPFGAGLPDGVIPHGTVAGILAELPRVELVGVWPQWRQMTLAHSEAEIPMLVQCARAGEAMAEALLETAAVGAEEHLLYAAATAAATEHGALSQHMILVTARQGESVGWGPPAWTYRGQEPARLEAGNLILAELFPIYATFETQQQVTFALGEVDSRVEIAADAARASYEEGLARLREGERFGSVVEAMLAPVEAVGGWCLTPPIHTVNPHALLGPCGFSSAIPEAADYATLGGVAPRGAEERLEAGICFALQANCTVGRHRVNLGGAVLVGEHGGIELNDLPNRLIRI